MSPARSRRFSLSARTGRRRARSNRVPPSRVLVRGGIVMVLFGALVWLATSLYNGVPGRDYLHMSATVPNVGNLLAHDPIRAAGVRVGQVTSVSTTDGGQARLGLQIDPGTKLPVDTHLVVRANGLLGGRFVELDAGTSDRDLGDGGQIQPASQSITLGVPETLDTFDAQTRSQLRNTLGGLGEGLVGRGTGVNQVILRGSQEMDHAQSLITTVLAPPGSVEALIPSLKAGIAPLDEYRDELTRFDLTNRALQPFITHRGSVRATLDAAPGALDAANTGLGTGRRLLRSVRDVATAASLTLPPAPAGLRTASALLREARGPLKRTNSLLGEVKPTVPALLQVTGALKPVLPPLGDAADRLAPMLRIVGNYKCDLINLGIDFRSMTGPGGNGSGPNGPLKEFRLQAVAPAEGELAQTQDTTGLLLKDGYPAPCKYGPTAYPDVARPGA